MKAKEGLDELKVKGVISIVEMKTGPSTNTLKINNKAEYEKLKMGPPNLKQAYML